MVTVTKLSKIFSEGGRDRAVLDNITHTFARGQFTALLGSSGSGKSTLLNVISGIEEPTSGSVEIDGVNITALADRPRTLFRRDHIGFIFQFFNLIPTLTVLENVTLPLELAGRNRQEAKKIGRTLLDQVGLGNRLDTFPDKLSGGEQQRVAIARALAPNPALLLADEPTGNLDSATGSRILSLLLDLTQRAGKTLIMATHSREIVPYSDTVLHVVDGKLVK